MGAQNFDFLFLAYLNTALYSHQLMLILLKSDNWLNFNQLLFKAMSFKCHAHILHSSRKRAETPRVLGLGGYIFDVEGNVGL
jgi:hypothetical protein